jgi:hypothetical protein
VCPLTLTHNAIGLHSTDEVLYSIMHWGIVPQFTTAHPPPRFTGISIDALLIPQVSMLVDMVYVQAG